MRLYKCFRHALSMVRHSKLRSWLTIVGIVIGVAAVIAIVSIGEGMQEALNAQLSGLGGDILTLSPGFSRGGSVFGQRGGGSGGGNFGGGSGGGAKANDKDTGLHRMEVQVLRGMPEIALIDTNVRGSVKVSYFGKNGTVSATGVDPAIWSQITTTKIKEGRMLTSADQNVIVIGGRLASMYFSQPLGINKLLNIEGNSFRVIGVLDDESTQIYMPIQMAYQVIPDKEHDSYDSIMIKVKDESALEESMLTIENNLMLARHVTNKTKDFSLTSSKQLQQTRADTLSSVNAFLLAIAGISLIVGAVGIANTMFTSVVEKTKEIGIMKAIGARNADILRIFLFNAVLIGMVGGIIGIILGTILSSALPALIGNIPFVRSTIVSLRSVVMALTVSIAVGGLAGSIPAYQASKLRPVDALRYE